MAACKRCARATLWIAPVIFGIGTKTLLNYAVLTMLLVHSALAGSDDHGDTRSEATELVLGSPLAGRIDSEGDVDVFRLELAATAAVEIFTTGTLDTIGTLEGALGERLVRNSGRYYVDDNFYIATRLEAGTYYLRVSSNFGRTGSYVVEAKSLDVTDLVLGSPLAGRIDSEGDVDVFRVEVDNAATVEIYITGALLMVSRLEGASGEVVARGDAIRNVRNDNIYTYIAKRLEAGVYYLWVGSDFGRTGNYIVEAKSWVDDHGDTVSDATKLVLGSPLAGQIGPWWDVDVFRFELAAGATVVIFTIGTLDTIGRLEGASGEHLVTRDDNDSDVNFYISRRLEAGVYYLWVSSYSYGLGSRTGSYILQSKRLTTDETDAIIPDPNLRTALRIELGKAPEEPISPGDLSTISGGLDLSARNIVDLTGIEHAFGVRALFLESNEIADLTPLAGLTGLRRLLLGRNEVEDLTPLAGLTGLYDLKLDYNEIGDLTPLAGSTGLWRLLLGHNRVRDLTPLAGLTGLEYLSLSSNEVGDLTPLAGLTSLKHLDLKANEVSDLTPLAGLTALFGLDLEINEVGDLTPLAGLTGLEYLDLRSNEIADLTPLAALTALSDLKLGRNEVADLTPLAGLTGLWELDLKSNEVGDLTPLAGLTGLEDLSLNDNGVEDLTPLAGLTKLRNLDLGYSEIGDLTPLAGLTELRILDLRSNKVADLTPLAGLTNLEDLSLNDNGVEDLTPLAGLTKLRNLDLGYNEIRDLTPLAGLTDLRNLDLGTNAIRDLSPLLQNPGLNSGDFINISSNPKADELIYQSLDDRGLQVNSNFAISDTDSDEFLNSYLTQIYNDNVLVMYLGEDLTRSFLRLPIHSLARDVHRHFEDKFDYLMFFSNLDNYSDNHDDRYIVPYGVYVSVMNDTMGTGQELFFDRRVGSRQLRGVLVFSFNSALLNGPSLHELQHAWANYAVPTSASGHWGFSSADGQLGGFDRSALVDHGGGRYSAGDFGTHENRGNSVPYSPIELYLAGLIEPEEVPDLWVAADGQWLDTNDEPRQFAASDVREYTIEEIIARVGPRNPPSTEQKRHFRGAVILLTDDAHPATESQLQELSEAVTVFSTAGSDERPSYNYFEATGGRASIAMGELSEFRKAIPGLPIRSASYETPPPPSFSWVHGGGSGIIHRVPTTSLDNQDESRNAENP